MNFDFQLGNDPANDPQREGWASDCGVKYWEVGEYRGLYSQLEVFLGIVLSADQARFGATGKWSDSCFGFSNPAGANGCTSLLSFMPHCLQWMDLYSPEYVYSADFQLFFDSFFSHPFGQACGRMTVGYGHQPPDEGLYFDFIEYLNSEAARRNVNKRLWDWRSSLDDQDESIRQYLARQCWEYEGRYLAPIRIEQNYAVCTADFLDAMPRMSWRFLDRGVWVPVRSRTPVGHCGWETRGRIDTRVAMADRARFFENRLGADHRLFDRMVAYVSKLETGGLHCANHFHCVFLIDPSGLTKGELNRVKIGLGERWRGVTRGQGLMYDCHERPDRDYLKAQGKWALDFIDCSDARQIQRFIDYVAGYFAGEKGQMLRVKPTAKARTLTMGR